MIQDIVDRHARSSFLLKGWSVTLISAVYLLATRSEYPATAMAIAVLPSLSFWGLDAYYLRQERLFRALYDHVRQAEEPCGGRFTLDTRPYHDAVQKWHRTIFSCSIMCFHLTIFISIVFAILLFITGGKNAAESIL